MRILITGAAGQLGTALKHELTGHDLALVDLPDVDVTQREDVFTSFTAFQPQVVVHCAALTDVDGCARNPTLAYRVNGLGTQNVALACREVGAALVHLSTNEVFAGDRPDGYEEWMPMNPRNPYGRSKAAAEFHVRNLLQAHYIVRTAWLYAPGGHNFVHAILNQMGNGRQIRVVADEIGNPTYVRDLAEAIAQLLVTGQYGTYHFTNEGACSRFTFAAEAVRLAGGITEQVVPILHNEFKRASTPPPFAALHNIAGAAIGIHLRPWQEALVEYVEEYVTARELMYTSAGPGPA